MYVFVCLVVLLMRGCFPINLCFVLFGRVCFQLIHCGWLVFFVFEWALCLVLRIINIFFFFIVFMTMTKRKAACLFHFFFLFLDGIYENIMYKPNIDDGVLNQSTVTLIVLSFTLTLFNFFFIFFLDRALKYDVNIGFHLYSNCSAFFGIHKILIFINVYFFVFSSLFAVQIFALHLVVYSMDSCTYIFFSLCANLPGMNFWLVRNISFWTFYLYRFIQFWFLFVNAFNLIFNHAYELFLCYACSNTL